ncbi:hypothetical protein C8R45DRAFT_1165966 [Mycena sanguinolenta]|nr:hypothetical protein C8R45DRAFT_1165966 [Mycena sanguinolenta]
MDAPHSSLHGRSAPLAPSPYAVYAASSSWLSSLSVTAHPSPHPRPATVLISSAYPSCLPCLSTPGIVRPRLLDCACLSVLDPRPLCASACRSTHNFITTPPRCVPDTARSCARSHPRGAARSRVVVGRTARTKPLSSLVPSKSAYKLKHKPSLRIQFISPALKRRGVGRAAGAVRIRVCRWTRRVWSEFTYIDYFARAVRTRSKAARPAGGILRVVALYGVGWTRRVWCQVKSLLGLLGLSSSSFRRSWRARGLLRWTTHLASVLGSPQSRVDGHVIIHSPSSQNALACTRVVWEGNCDEIAQTAPAPRMLSTSWPWP